MFSIRSLSLVRAIPRSSRCLIRSGIGRPLVRRHSTVPVIACRLSSNQETLAQVIRLQDLKHQRQKLEDSGGSAIVVAGCTGIASVFFALSPYPAMVPALLCGSVSLISYGGYREARKDMVGLDAQIIELEKQLGIRRSDPLPEKQ